MQVLITNQNVIDFCRKYPSFSIESTLVEYVDSVNRLSLAEGNSIFECVTSTSEKMMKALDGLRLVTESSVVSNEKNVKDVLDLVKSTDERYTSTMKRVVGDCRSGLVKVVNDTEQTLWRSINNSRETVISTVRGLSNGYTLSDLENKVANLLKNTPNEQTLGYLKNVLEKSGGGVSEERVVNLLKNTPNEQTLGYLKDVLEKSGGGVSEERVVTLLKNTPNEQTLGYLKDVLEKSGDSEELVRTVKTVPNDILLGHVTSVMDCVRESRNEGLALAGKVTDVDSAFKEYISSFKTGSVKGRNTEIKTLMALETVFPNHDVLSVPSSKQKGKMDIILSHPDYPDISIDTKNYTKSVPKTEVMKFEGDMMAGDTHGIMVSVSSKIIGKPHFSIDVVNGNVGVYLSNTGGDTECIRIAVEIVYSLSKVLTRGDGRTLKEGALRSIEDIVRDDVIVLGRMKSNLTSVLEDVKKMSVGKIAAILQSG